VLQLDTHCGASQRAISGFNMASRFWRMPEAFNGAQTNRKMSSRRQLRHIHINNTRVEFGSDPTPRAVQPHATTMRSTKVGR